MLASSDLSIVKTADVLFYVTGGMIVNYTIEYQNNGTTDMTGVTIVDSLSGLEFVTSSPMMVLSGNDYLLT